MNALVRRVLRLLATRGQVPALAGGGIVESLVQTFENWRPGLPNAATHSSAHEFYINLYEKETPRLQESIRVELSHLSAARRREYFRDFDELARQVLLPAYLRHAVDFTGRERMKFYHVSLPLQGLERVFWAVAGALLGAFVIWAPFIPLWSKEWVLPFMVVGFFFPDIRRYMAIRAYEGDLDELVSKTDRELQRIELSYLTASSEGERVADEFPSESAEPSASGPSRTGEQA